MKRTGKRRTGNPFAPFEVAGAGDGLTANLHGHEAGNGGHSQGEPAGHRASPRPYYAHDLPAIRRLMEAESGFWQSDWSDVTLAKAMESAGDLALVWEEEDSVTGFVCAHDLGFRAYLSELIVAPRARRQGVGRSLVEHIQAELARRGRRILIADVWHDAESFWRSLGWEPPDAVLLRRRLASTA